MENREKIVAFDIWCPKCKHREKKEEQEPCCDCLDEPMNIDSHKPVYWEERE